MNSKEFRNMNQEEFDVLRNKIVQYIKKYQEKGSFPNCQIVCMDLDLTLAQLQIIQQLYPEDIKIHNFSDMNNCEVEYLFPAIPFDKDGFDEDGYIEIVDNDD